MKNYILLLLACLTFAFVSCKKDEGGGSTPPGLCGTDDFAFPANATKFSVTLYSECSSVSVGQEFFVKLVVYNIADAFGAATELTIPTDKFDIVSAASGSAFQPASDIISLGGPVTGTNIYAYGVTYKAGTASRTNGSGVVVRLRLKAKAAGAATISINPAKLEIKKADGTPITNFATIAIENATITIQ